ncbi:MAG: hypothetical protein U9P71_02425 [Campylobacterota bacterium]|nr:hypothetical protein [Campylobacterota bacterium]
MNTLNKNIKEQFVTSLMNYFKIEEDINLRAHIADLTQSIEANQYREFFRRLSTSVFEYKTAYEKIALVVQSFEDERIASLFSGVKERVKKLYDVMYELHKMIILDETSITSALERFLHVYFAKLRDKSSNKLVLDALDIEVIKNITKEWIFNHVSYDKSLFLERVELEYKNVIIARQQQEQSYELSNNMKTYLLTKEQH